MEGIKIAVFAFVLYGFQFYSIQCQSCGTMYTFSGEIYEWTQYGYKRCWNIPVPSGCLVQLQMKEMASKLECDEDYVRIRVAETGDEFKICSTDNKNPITVFGNVTVIYAKEKEGTTTEFTLKYTVQSIECLNTKSFKCDENFCVPEEKVCDGVNDCANGRDETDCETGVATIKEVPEVRKKAVSWLKRKRNAVLGWRDKTPRAVVALYLASAASFNGTVLEEELMARQAEFQIAVALLKPSLTNADLSMLINALLVTCHNPRQFYGNDLVKRLKLQVEESGNVTHPLAYLALCNANESWPLKATSDLKSILNNNSEYPFVKDLQAMAIMALSCEANKSRNTSDMLNNTTLRLYRETIQNFKKLQAYDGSFGNVHTTALITQALFSSGQEHSRDWNLNATIKYLIKEMNSSSVNFLATYLILPILNRQSLMNISYVNCSAYPRKHGDDPYSEIADDEVPKLRVQYSLYVGDENPAVHTIFLKVQDNSTAFKVMELAETTDRKYKFEWKTTSGKMYVYEIANIQNDPETGKFWLLYIGKANSSEPLTHLAKSPDEIFVGDGEHLVLWYKTITIQ